MQIEQPAAEAPEAMAEADAPLPPPTITVLLEGAEQPSTSSLELDLPLSPVLASPLEHSNSNCIQSATCDAAGAAAGDCPSVSPLRSGTSRQLLAVKRVCTEVWAFGRGDLGQLGDGSTEDAYTPRLVKFFKGRDIVNLSTSALHAAAVTSDGELYMYGSNDESQLGIRKKGDALVPTRVNALENFHVQQVACGPSHTLALMDGGAVAAFGSSEFGQTGLPGSTQVELPRVVKDLRSMHVVRVAAGGSHTLALSSTGGVFSCGNGSFGALGRGTTEGTDVPRPISRLWPLGIVQVACGENHSAALTVEGGVLTWGRGRYGALGHGDFENRSIPQPVQALRGVVGAQVSCGDDHTVLLTADGSVYAWGRGTWGQTGQAHTDNICQPQLVSGALEGQRIVQVAAGGRHTLCLGAGNQLFAFGNNECGQMAAPPCDSQPSAQLVQGLPDCPILFVAAGGDTTSVVLDRGSSLQAGLIGPCASRLHGGQWCAVAVPDLLSLVTQAAARKGDRAAVEDVIVAVESTFGSPGYILATFSKRQHLPFSDQHQQEEQLQQEKGRWRQQEKLQEQQGEGSDAVRPMNESPTEQPPGAAAFVDSTQQQQQQAQGQQQQQRAAVGGVLDTERISTIYQALLKLYEPEVAAALGSVCVRLLDMLERFLNSLVQQEQQATQVAASSKQQQPPAQQQPRPDLSWVAPVLFVLLQNPLNSDPSGYGGKLLLRISRIVSVTLPAQERLSVRQALTALLSTLPAEVLAARCVRPVQRYIDGCAQTGLGATRVQVMMAGVLLDILRQVNEDSGNTIPYTEFHNKQLSEHANLMTEYMAWRHNSNNNALCSICQMPYLLTPEAKSFIMHGEAAMQQQHHLSAAAMQAFFQGVSPASAAFLQIRVRRTHVVEDALNQLVYMEARDLKKPLRVTFITGGMPEPAQDEGGVTKELFQLLTRNLFKPEFAMFTHNEQTRTDWFNAASLEAEIEYALVGTVMGLAIYNGVILDVHFPMVVYKKLLGLRPTFGDLKATFPDLGRGLQQLLGFEGDVEAVFCRSFTAEYEFYGEVKSVELKPGGADVPVTATNRREYVDLYTRWLLEGSIEKQFAAFRSGFMRVCGGPALTLFTPAELELLVCGLPHLDFDALERVAKYEGGYSREHQVVRWFWEVLHSLSLDQKRTFLQFTTGSDRAPVGGLAKLSLLIQRAGPDTEHLPTSHTCFNSLLLPEYANRDKLRAKLLTAVENAQGFGLQ